MNRINFPGWLIVIGVGLLLAALSGCVQTPYYRLPTRDRAYNLPPCQLQIPGAPCQAPVVHTVVSACEKRFGKKLCQ